MVTTLLIHATVLTSATTLVLKCDMKGSLRRVGGQGDILSGAIATFLAWGKNYEDRTWK